MWQGNEDSAVDMAGGSCQAGPQARGRRAVSDSGSELPKRMRENTDAWAMQGGKQGLISEVWLIVPGWAASTWQVADLTFSYAYAG